MINSTEGLDMMARSGHDGQRVEKVLYEEGTWRLMSTENNAYLAAHEGWKSVIRHYCSNVSGIPYWMLLEYADSPTQCTYCCQTMPVGIVALFKLQNWDVIK